MALRIKDSVDLKELESFGFRKITKDDGFHYIAKHKMIYERILYADLSPVYTVYINKDNYIRICTNESCTIAGTLQTLLYDLFQAGLVERVDDK